VHENVLDIPDEELAFALQKGITGLDKTSDEDYEHTFKVLKAAKYHEQTQAEVFHETPDLSRNAKKNAVAFFFTKQTKFCAIGHIARKKST